MTARNELLSAITTGDIIFGVAEGGQEKLLLVTGADAHRIVARHVTSQRTVVFRRDGKSEPTWDGGSCRITSVAPLPFDAHEAALGLDRKMRDAREDSDFRLTDAEKRLLLMVGPYFAARPLPVQ